MYGTGGFASPSHDGFAFIKTPNMRRPLDVAARAIALRLCGALSELDGIDRLFKLSLTRPESAIACVEHRDVSKSKAPRGEAK
jgi:hypothetical protein